MLYDYLVDNYRPAEPIFSMDIEIENMSDVNLRRQLKLLADAGKIVRYEQGIYYLPEMSDMNLSVEPSPDIVARYKYISRKDRVDGYYSGYTFANQLGLCMQVPLKKEIVSNNIAAKVREIIIGKQQFIVRKSNIPVTMDNVVVLQLLDLLKNLEKYEDDRNMTECCLSRYVKANKIKRSDIDKYIGMFPDSTYRNFYETGLEYVLAV